MGSEILHDYLEAFNKTLEKFQKKFPVSEWTEKFKTDLINDFSYYSSRVEDENITYGSTIKFLNDEIVPKTNLKSLLNVSHHKEVLEGLLCHLENFALTEEKLKGIHKHLMSDPNAWEVDFEPHLVGNYRNLPTIGHREPFYPNKEYADHFNLEHLMESHLYHLVHDVDHIDNSTNQYHLITILAKFHNIFLNDIHPFADGNGRVCRIVMGAIMMKNMCPPIFKRILNDKDQYEYIETVIKCEQVGSNDPLVKFLAIGMTNYLNDKLN
ncbi:Fic family protein [Flavobacterium lindanitolerans]|uniref:Fic family protein n=1 Tax=Flavobacterium lindanitolerans TaxID=428988 RepID=UPI0023F0768F|nr:Fic family protein [Flavobacterium lindanitolerans]